MVGRSQWLLFWQVMLLIWKGIGFVIWVLKFYVCGTRKYHLKPNSRHSWNRTVGFIVAWQIDSKCAREVQQICTMISHFILQISCITFSVYSSSDYEYYPANWIRQAFWYFLFLHSCSFHPYLSILVYTLSYNCCPFLLAVYWKSLWLYCNSHFKMEDSISKQQKVLILNTIASITASIWTTVIWKCIDQNR